MKKILIILLAVLWAFAFGGFCSAAISSGTVQGDSDRNGKLDDALGGTNADSSAWNGVPVVNSGVWSSSPFGTAGYFYCNSSGSCSFSAPSSLFNQPSIDAVFKSGNFGSGNITTSGGVSAGSATIGTTGLVQLLADNSTDETATIQAALNSYNHVILVPKPGSAKVALISSPVVISSNQWLELAPDLTIAFKFGTSPRNMLKNKAVSTYQRQITDAAMSTTANQTTLTSATANFTSADVGRSVVVAGAAASGNNLTALISSVTNSTTAVLSVAAQTTVSGATATIYDRDSNIRVSGGTWNRASVPVGTVSNDASINFHFRRVDGLIIENTNMLVPTSIKNCIDIGDSTRFDVRHITGTLATGSGWDLVHIEGACKNGSIKWITGSTDDDMICLSTVEYPAQRDMVGDIENVTVEDVFAYPAGKSAVKLMSGPGTTLKNVSVLRVYGYGDAGVNCFDDPTSGIGYFDNILIDGVKFLASKGCPATVNPTNGGNLVVRNIQDMWPSNTISYVLVDLGSWSNALIDGLEYHDAGVTPGNSTRQWVKLEPSKTVGNLTIKNCKIDNNTGGNMIELAGNVDKLAISDCQFTGTETSNGRIVNYGAVTVNSTQFNNIQMYKGRTLFDAAAGGTIGPIQVSNFYAKGTGRIAALQSNIDIMLSNAVIDSLVSGAFYANGANLTVRGSGVNRVTAWTGINRVVGTEVIHVVNPEFPVDLSILAKSDGDKAYNTNGALACGIGLVISNGSAWKNLYSGATY